MLVATHGADIDDYLVSESRGDVCESRIGSGSMTGRYFIRVQLAASVAVMAVTNGYVSSVMMMYGPAKVGYTLCVKTISRMCACEPFDLYFVY